jgi:hypothetical protein
MLETWTLHTVYVVMGLQTNLIIIKLHHRNIANHHHQILQKNSTWHVTDKWTLTTTDAMKTFQAAVSIILSYSTHHRNTYGHHYHQIASQKYSQSPPPNPTKEFHMICHRQMDTYHYGCYDIPDCRVHNTVLFHTSQTYTWSPHIMCWCVMTHLNHFLDTTGIRLLQTMYALMCQTVLLSECLSTYIRLWLLPTMYVLMKDQMTLSVWMLRYIHHRSVATPHYVCADVWSHDFYNWMPSYIQHKSMPAPHYVCATVWSDDSSDWMPSYTQNRSVAAPHYVCADVWSDYPSDWMPSYIHHRSVATPHFVCADVWSD